MRMYMLRGLLYPDHAHVADSKRTGGLACRYEWKVYISIGET